jgi:hypothetical protein
LTQSYEYDWAQGETKQQDCTNDSEKGIIAKGTYLLINKDKVNVLDRTIVSTTTVQPFTANTNTDG